MKKAKIVLHEDELRRLLVNDGHTNPEVLAVAASADPLLVQIVFTSDDLELKHETYNQESRIV